MKITVDVDCTPIEARSFLGLPDLTPVHEHYVRAMTDAMTTAGSIEQMDAMVRTFSPMGEAGLKMFQSMMQLGSGAMSAASKG